MPFLKTLLFTLLVPASVTILVPQLLLSANVKFWPDDFSVHWLLGFTLIGIGAAFYFKCAWDFASFGKGTPVPLDPPRNFVARGLYRLVRNPMYVGVLLVLIGQALIFRSFLILGYTILMWLCFHLFVTLYEEPTLRKKFGSSYDEYCRTVPRWFPAWYRKMSS